MYAIHKPKIIVFGLQLLIYLMTSQIHKRGKQYIAMIQLGIVTTFIC